MPIMSDVNPLFCYTPLPYSAYIYQWYNMVIYRKRYDMQIWNIIPITYQCPLMLCKIPSSNVDQIRIWREIVGLYNIHENASDYCHFVLGLYMIRNNNKFLLITL